MYVKRSIIYEKAAFLAGTGVRKFSFVKCEFSSIQIHYSDKRIKFIFFNEISLLFKKKLNFIYSILLDVVRKFSFLKCEFSSIQIHYSDKRIKFYFFQ